MAHIPYSKVLKGQLHPRRLRTRFPFPTTVSSSSSSEEEEEEFFNHYKNDLERHAHTPSGVAGADLKS